ncbi:hypothetical protein GGR57DRAFT_108796 [Xylariaceae sp. FL1272]|nr:hypothetical protein GGR57DRAFT_108796 [Xylariaceae sp. FL1272]
MNWKWLGTCCPLKVLCCICCTSSRKLRVINLKFPSLSIIPCVEYASISSDGLAVMLFRDSYLHRPPPPPNTLQIPIAPHLVPSHLICMSIRAEKQRRPSMKPSAQLTGHPGLEADNLDRGWSRLEHDSRALAWVVRVVAHPLRRDS